MTANWLQGRTVLSTRPRAVSAFLAESILAAGGRTLHQPALAIQPPADPEQAEQALRHVQDVDALIFVSKNAVQYALAMMADIAVQARGKNILAVGPGSSRALQEAGFSEVIYTDNTSGSEALLNEAVLQAATIAGKQVMIIRGEGGRTLLGDTLQARGAKIIYAELYRRVKPQFDPVIMRELWQRERPDVVLITSAEALDNLIEMTAEQQRSILLQTPLLLISERLRGIAESRGFGNSITVAKGNSDEDCLLALKEIFKANSDE